MTKRYEEETNLRHYVVLDTSASMGYAGAAGISKLAYGATLAGALHVLMARQRDATGLVAFDRTVHTLVPPGSTRGHVRTLLARLAGWADGAAPGDGAHTNAADALHRVAERIPRRSLVTADLGPVRHRRRRRRGRRAPTRPSGRCGTSATAATRSWSSTCSTARPSGGSTCPTGPVRVRDLETGEERTLQPAQVREGYRAAADAFLDGLARACRQSGVDYQPLDTARPYADALRAYLDKRRRLY